MHLVYSSMCVPNQKLSHYTIPPVSGETGGKSSLLAGRDKSKHKDKLSECVLNPHLCGPISDLFPNIGGMVKREQFTNISSLYMQVIKS